MKKGLLIVAAVLMLAGAAQAGEIKLHVWPCVLVPQDFTTCKVTMDIGYWIGTSDQNKTIKMNQLDVHTYDGCTTIKVKCNFNATLSASIAKFTQFGDVGGSLTCTINPANLLPSSSGTDVQVCAHLINANLGNFAGGTKDVQVATVSIKVVPTV